MKVAGGALKRVQVVSAGGGGGDTEGDSADGMGLGSLFGSELFRGKRTAGG